MTEVKGPSEAAPDLRALAVSCIDALAQGIPELRREFERLPRDIRRAPSTPEGAVARVVEDLDDLSRLLGHLRRRLLDPPPGPPD